MNERHLSPDEVDAYWTGGLPVERVRAFEEHLLCCAECRGQAEGVEELRAALRRPQPRRGRRLGRAATPLLAAAAVLAIVIVDDVRLRSLARHEQAPSGWQQLDLEPPQRGPQRQELRLAPSVRFVELRVDMREAGIPGTPFDVWLLDSREEAVLLLRRLRSGADGSVSIAVPASQLSGDQLLRLRAGDVVVEKRFRVEALIPR